MIIILFAIRIYNRNLGGDMKPNHEYMKNVYLYIYYERGRRGYDRMVVRFTATCVISAYHP